MKLYSRNKAPSIVAVINFSFIFINHRPPFGGSNFLPSRARAQRIFFMLPPCGRGQNSRTVAPSETPLSRALLPYSPHWQARIKQRTGVTLRPRTMCVTLSSLDILCSFPGPGFPIQRTNAARSQAGASSFSIFLIVASCVRRWNRSEKPVEWVRSHACARTHERHYIFFKMNYLF